MVALPRKPLAVLWILLTRAGEVVTKDELLAAVWPSVVVTDGVLASCLRDLRQALGDDTRRPTYIATAHRIGYRFIGPIERSPPGATALPGAATPPPGFVGRTIELARLRSAFEQALAGRRQLLFVTGEAGIGKTRLIEQFSAGLPRTEVTLVHGQCLEHHGAGEPYLPLLEVLGRLCRGTDGARHVASIQRHAPTWLLQLPGLVDETTFAAVQLRVAGSSVERMQRELVELLDVLAATRAMILVLEDMHWSDPSTVDWLAMLARRREASRLLVIITTRPVELILHRHPLRALKQELLGRGDATELLPGYLTPEDVSSYIDQRLPGEGLGLASSVYLRSHGHPLFMRHIADDLARREPAPAALAPPVLPVSLRALIDAQVARLAAELQQVLEAASVVGHDFAAASVSAALGQAVDDVERLLEELVRHGQFIEARGLVRWHDGTVSGAFGFRHDLHRETLYGRLGAGRRAQLHQRIGNRLAEAHGEQVGSVAAELALHFEQAQDGLRSAHFIRLAAEVALSRQAFAETCAHVSRGLDLLALQPPGALRDQAELPLRVIHGAVLLTTEGYGSTEAESTYLRAHALSLQSPDRASLAPVLSGLWNAYLTRADFSSARRVADEFGRLATERPELEVLAYAFKAQRLFFTGRPTEALQHFERSLALYDPARHRHLVLEYGEDPCVVIHHGAALASWFLGYDERARRHLDGGLAAGRALGHPYSEAQMLWMDGVIAYDGGDATRLRRVADRLLATCRENRFALWLPGGRMLLGAALAHEGRLDEGLAEAEAGLGESREVAALTLPFWLALVAGLHARRGQLDSAAERLDEAVSTAHRTGEAWYVAELLRLQGSLLLRRGRSAAADRQAAEARRCFEQAVDLARLQGATRLEQRAAASLAGGSDRPCAPGRGGCAATADAS